MCGVVGAIIDQPSADDLELLYQVFIETEIRGKHASGIAWWDGKKNNSFSKSVPISELLSEFCLEDAVYEEDGIYKLKLIGHIRYSTSDLDYNQPIGDGNSFIVHNGVISQEDPSNWKEHYGYDCNTKNDTELLYNCMLNEDDYEEKFPGCSVSAIALDSLGNIHNFRNGKRPQWVGKIPSGEIIASTKNILLRAGITEVEKVQCDDEMIYRSMDEQNTRLQTLL